MDAKCYKKIIEMLQRKTPEKYQNLFEEERKKKYCRRKHIYFLQMF